MVANYTLGLDQVHINSASNVAYAKHDIKGHDISIIPSLKYEIDD